MERIYNNYFIQSIQKNEYETLYRIALILKVDNKGNKLFECIGPVYSNFFDASRALVLLVSDITEQTENLNIAG